ncbi:MAG: zinc-dependent metalloprotease, partial [Armatimonadota bacterium]
MSIRALRLVAVLWCIASPAWLASRAIPASETPPAKPPTASDAKAADKAEAEKKKDDLDDFDEVTKEAEKIEGLFTFYRKKDKVYVEIKPEQLDKDYIFTITLESGIGINGLYNGMPLSDGLFCFRRVNDMLHFVIRNPGFRARKDLPVKRSVERAFSDSVLASVKLESVHKERKSLLVDLGPIFLTDLAGLGPSLKSALGSAYNFDANKSYFGRIKSFPLNSELETYCAYNTSDPKYITTLPDSRSLTLRVHYSLSELPQSDYRPRLADSRVGYFITAYQDFSTDEDPSPFVRYINRWNLKKKDPNVPISEPVKPIVFWLENTIPVEYREPIKEGVLRWNLAFEKAGFKNAIVVKQQPDNADWDPADVRYNTIRWLHSVDSAFAMGPSRVNPLTGEILDADIVIDANFVRAVKYGYRAQIARPSALEVYNAPYGRAAGQSAYDVEALLGFPALPVISSEESELWNRPYAQRMCMAGPIMAQQAHFGLTAIALRDGLSPDSPVPKEYLDQFWADLVCHEVGHTLGLRHNFHGSTLLPPDKLHDKAVVAEKGLHSSVMDYNPVNIAISKSQQGYYYSPKVGPYDIWAIQYGYTPIDAPTPEAELPVLRKIAERCTEPELAYGTDEDAYDRGGPTAVDPLIITGDLSSDPITFHKQRMELAKSLLKRLEQTGPGYGRPFEEFRQQFGTLLSPFYTAGNHLSRWIGGQYFSRNHAGDKGWQLPLRPVPASKQREALHTIVRYILAEDALKFSPDTLNKLVPPRWSHWGQDAPAQLDYP